MPEGRASAPEQATPSAPPSQRLLVDDVTVHYTGRGGDPVHAVEDVTFGVADNPGRGEVVVLLGPSGCGKSTLLKCIAGLLAPTRGRVLVDGMPVEGTSRDRGMVFQSYTSFAWLTVQRNVEYGLKLAGVPRTERAERARDALARVGLADFARRYPKELSGGMKQRVAIARSLVNSPKLLLMDEPFGALDPQTRWGMQGLMLDISRELDNTVVFVTHDVSEAVYVADSILVLTSRPAKVLQRVEVPYFGERDPSLKQTPGFREIESRVLDLLQGQPGNLRITR